MTANTTEFENFLDQFSENDWTATIVGLLPAIHEVDRNAVQIWFRFYPLALFRYLQKAENKAALVQKFVMQGNYELTSQIDESHHFLYGHKFWSEVKNAVSERLANGAPASDLATEIKSIAKSAAGKVNADESLLTAISAVGLMTLVQSGRQAFESSAGKPTLTGIHDKSPAKVVEERRRQDSQGFFGFLKTVNKEYTVTFDEARDKRFKGFENEEVASAAARENSEDWSAKDPRRIEGPIPVECRSASCGVCWVGVLGGAENLSDVEKRERTRLQNFGYVETSENKPLMRLACQARLHGAVTVVIPPWNGNFGKDIYGVPEVELEPVTTSAVELRQTLGKVGVPQRDNKPDTGEI